MNFHFSKYVNIICILAIKCFGSTVVELHNVVHLNNQLQKVENTFNMDRNGKYVNYNDYMESLVVLPVLLLSLGTLLVIFSYVFHKIPQKYLSFYTCNSTNEYVQSIQKYLHSLIIFGVCLSMVLVVIGYSKLIKGSSSAVNSIDILTDLFTYFYISGKELLLIGNNINDSLEQASTSCPMVSLYQPLIDSYITYAETYILYVEDVASASKLMSRMLSRYGIIVSSVVVWVLFFLGISIVLAAFVYIHYNHSKIRRDILSRSVPVISWLFLASCCLCMILLVIKYRMKLYDSFMTA